MPSERIQRQIDCLLDEAEQALTANDWERVRELANNALRLDPENADAVTFLAAANRDLGQPRVASSSPEQSSSPAQPLPESFAAAVTPFADSSERVGVSAST